MKTDLLMDAVLRLTYKRPGDEQLRGLLKRARRLVLADEMAAFLYQLESEIFDIFEIPDDRLVLGRRWLMRAHRRLDDCRHFARLPHEVTWVEYSLEAMLAREVAYRATTKSPYKNAEADLAQVRADKSRVGWLLQQHPKIETAFQAEYFLGPASGHHVAYSCGGIVWQTDDDPLPWPDLISGKLQYGQGGRLRARPCEFVAGIPEYERPNVGLRQLPKRPCFATIAPTNLMNRGRMMWAFLAMFNKVPILGTNEVAISHGFVARGGYHKFLTHSVVTINIPEKAGIRKIARAALSIIRRRAHEVRGHWRDDWRLPKGNKSIWIAEHIRGDASLGFVTHDYHVTHEGGD